MEEERAKAVREEERAKYKKYLEEKRYKEVRKNCVRHPPLP